MVKSKSADEFEGGLVPSVPVHEEEVTEEVEEKLGGADLDAVRGLVQQAMNARDAEIQALRAELDAVKASGGGGGMIDENASVGGYPWMYWKKPLDWRVEDERGWISYGPGGPSPNGNRDAGSYNRYLRKGFIPVTRYGYIEPPTTSNAVDSFMPLLKKGGAKEFPASQVIAYGWHERPPIRGLVFDQLEAVRGNVISFTCESCGHSLSFLKGKEAQAGEAYRAHLMTSHKYPFREAAEAVKGAGLTITAFKRVAD